MMLLCGPKKNGILFLYTLLITDIFLDLLYLMLTNLLMKLKQHVDLSEYLIGIISDMNILPKSLKSPHIESFFVTQKYSK